MFEPRCPTKIILLAILTALRDWKDVPGECSIEFSHAAPDFPLSPVFRFLITFSLTYDHSALTPRWYLCRKMLRVSWTVAVRSHLIDNMPKTCACVGCTNHNMMGKDISFYKFPDKTSKQQHWERWWVQSLKRVNPDGTPWIPVCSEHFLTGEPFIVLEILCLMTSSHKPYVECHNSLIIYE